MISPFLTILLLSLTSTSTSTTPLYGFPCTSPTPCTSLITYTSPNTTTFSSISTLFQTPLPSILASNNLPQTTLPSKPIPPNTSIRVPFPCTCNNSSGSSSHPPTYTVKPGDGLDMIARTVFMQLVTFQQIQAANNIVDAGKIDAGQILSVPLPCSCDEVKGEKVVSLGMVVQPGSTVEGIAAEFGADAETIMEINGIKKAKDLLAGAVLDVPLPACSSSFSNTSLDYNLLVPNGSYALTANNCVVCSCISMQLNCYANHDTSLKCPKGNCGNLLLGNISSSGCNTTSCMYNGFTNTTGFNILVHQELNSTCSNGGGSTRLRLKDSAWVVVLFILHAILM